MPPVEKSKGLLITPGGTPQQKVVSVLSCDPVLPCYGFFASSRCVPSLLSYFLRAPKKVPGRASVRSLVVNKFRFHVDLDVRGTWRVSTKSSPEMKPGSIGNVYRKLRSLGRKTDNSEALSASLGRLLRLEHACGNAGYETPRNESLSKNAEVIPEPRNDKALSGGERAQAGSRHFLRSFSMGPRPSHVRLTGDLREF